MRFIHIFIKGRRIFEISGILSTVFVILFALEFDYLYYSNFPKTSTVNVRLEVISDFQHASPHYNHFAAKLPFKLRYSSIY